MAHHKAHGKAQLLTLGTKVRLTTQWGIAKQTASSPRTGFLGIEGDTQDHAFGAEGMPSEDGWLLECEFPLHENEEKID